MCVLITVCSALRTLCLICPIFGCAEEQQHPLLLAQVERLQHCANNWAHCGWTGDISRPHYFTDTCSMLRSDHPQLSVILKRLETWPVWPRSQRSSNKYCEVYSSVRTGDSPRQWKGWTQHVTSQLPSQGTRCCNLLTITLVFLGLPPFCP